MKQKNPALFIFLSIITFGIYALVSKTKANKEALHTQPGATNVPIAPAPGESPVQAPATPSTDSPGGSVISPGVSLQPPTSGVPSVPVTPPEPTTMPSPPPPAVPSPDPDEPVAPPPPPSGPVSSAL